MANPIKTKAAGSGAVAAIASTNSSDEKPFNSKSQQSNSIELSLLQTSNEKKKVLNIEDCGQEPYDGPLRWL